MKKALLLAAIALNLSGCIVISPGPRQMSYPTVQACYDAAGYALPCVTPALTTPTIYDPRYYAMPYDPGFAVTGWFFQPGFIVWIGSDGRRYHHRYNGFWHAEQHRRYGGGEVRFGSGHNGGGNHRRDGNNHQGGNHHRDGGKHHKEK